ncbi:histidine phosphatase family protein [Allosalinactinospora lopnorensis]|uniref:histidine phosphatase family protein n=1 Tax=Allosalinactinospora lopnorensis TaxID=1352348 RepID=UPI000623DA78|nr:histidine phosphatase family protein [Allosalinactinospora lopnorensis]
MSTETELIVVRHGETAWHAENRYAGSTDIELTDRGVRQADALGRWAATAGITGVLSSPLRRASHTADAAARYVGLPVAVDDRLAEVDFGDGEGLTAAEMREKFAAARDRFEIDPVRSPLPGGEDPLAATARGRAALLAAAGPGGRVLVVAHGTLLRLVLCAVLGIPLRSYRDVFPVVNNCRGARLRLRGGAFSLLGLNEALER